MSRYVSAEIISAKYRICYRNVWKFDGKRRTSDTIIEGSDILGEAIAKANRCKELKKYAKGTIYVLGWNGRKGRFEEIY